MLNNLIVIGVMAFVAVRYGECGPTCREAVRLDRRRDRIRGQWIVGLGTTAGIAAMTVRAHPGDAPSDITLRWNPNWRHPIIATVVRLAGWTVGYVAANQIALLRRAAARQRRRPTGTVTAYQYAFIFFQLPHGLVAVTLMTTFLPELQRRRGPQRLRRVQATVLRRAAADDGATPVGDRVLFVFAGPVTDIAARTTGRSTAVPPT